MLREAGHGHKMKHRLGALANILKFCLEELKKDHLHRGCVMKMMQFFQDVINENGYLDMSKPM